jgi:two-component system, OmpR family, phosphate regulon sensor histidine kinase PhoR
VGGIDGGRKDGQGRDQPQEKGKGQPAMKTTKWFLHPFLILIFSIIALGASLFLYIYWYLEFSVGLKLLADRFHFDPTQVLEIRNWVVILVLSLLVGIILMGISIIFIYNIKTFQLYRLQNNFINNFTHELKTPVTSLKLYLETFRKYDIPREKRIKYLEYMISDVNRLTDDIDRILNLARIESKSFSCDFVRTDVVAFTRNFVESNSHLFSSSRIQISAPAYRSFFYEINLPLFEMLLMNLLTNAIKYNTSEAPGVTISFEQKNRQLLIRVEDNGIGIEKGNLKKIFKKFYQVGSPDNMSARGTGLGLYLVDHIVRLHRGRIAAFSRGPHQGSAFTVSFPLPSQDRGTSGD